MSSCSHDSDEPPRKMGCYGATFNVQEGLGFLPQPLVTEMTHCDHMWPHLKVIAIRNVSKLKESSFCLAWGTGRRGMQIPLTAHSHTWNC